MHCRTLWINMVLCSAIARAIRGQSFFCSQTPTEASDACKFECQYGFERDVAPELERLSHENSRCRLNGIIVSLMPSVQFANRTLTPHWFNGDVRIIQLALDLRTIDHMEPYSFEADAFRSIVKLTLRLMQIAQLQTECFAGLRALRELKFHELGTRSFIPGWLASVGPTLELLLVYGPDQPTFDLNGLTGDAPMTALRFIHYSLNLDAAIDERTFRGLSQVQTLELTSCSIESIGAGAFDSLGNRLQQLKLDKNRLRQLPVGIFDRLLPSVGLTVFLDGNQWECRCGLEYLQFVLKEHREMFLGYLHCASPPPLLGRLIETTELCENGEEVEFHQQLECVDDDLESFSKSIAYRRHTLQLMLDDNVLLVMHNRLTTDPWLLVRFSVAGHTAIEANVNDEWRMGCAFDCSDRQRLRLTHNWPHLLCLMVMAEPQMSPLDCATYLPMPVQKQRTPWLFNFRKTYVATALAFGMVGCFIVGALTMFTAHVFLRNPHANHNTSLLVFRDMEQDTYDYVQTCHDYVEMPDTISGSTRRFSSRLQASLAFRFLMQQLRSPPYIQSLQRCNSDPLLVYQSRFDVVPPKRSNSLIYVYSSRFDLVPPKMVAIPGQRASIASTRL